MKAFWELVMAHDALRPIVAERLARWDMTRDDMVELAFAVYLGCALTHSGQNCAEYAILSAFQGNLGYHHEQEVKESELYAEIMTALKGEVC